MEITTQTQQGMKRAMLLYRVSTKKQVDQVKDDIPMQKIACRAYAEEKGWQIVGEKEEKGISGFKVSATKRDAIQALKEAAIRQEFDVLLVFMFDRLGRIESETPFVLEWFTSHGIEVWSVNEGQQKMEHHVDKLMNYIRFWQASGESEKTSIRVKTRHKQMTEEGIYTGGVVPLGYRLAFHGRLNKKGAEMKDLEIDPDDAEIVRLIFNKVVNEGYGSHRMAELLNSRGLRTRNDAKYTSNMILRILKRKIYIGYIERGGNISERIESLVIIPDQLYEKAQDFLKQRNGKNEEKRSIAMSNRGHSLLNGNIYCYHCKERLTTSRYVETYTRKDGSEYRVEQGRYVCYHRSHRLNDCDGATTYNGDKIDAAIMEAMRKIFANIKGCPQESMIEEAYRRAVAGNREMQQRLEAEIKKNTKQLDVLRGEIVKALSGDSLYSSEDLSTALQTLRDKINADETELKRLKDTEMEQKTLSQGVIPAYRQFQTWAEQFEAASFDAKKMIASQLFERVEVEKGYILHITLNMTYKQFCDDWLKVPETVDVEKQVA